MRMKLSAKFIFKSSTVAIAVLISSIGINQSRLNKMTCECGDICMHNGHFEMSCPQPGCAREHNAPLRGHAQIVENDLKKATHAAEKYLEEMGEAASKWLSSRTISKMALTR